MSDNGEQFDDALFGSHLRYPTRERLERLVQNAQSIIDRAVDSVQDGSAARDSSRRRGVRGEDFDATSDKRYPGQERPSYYGFDFPFTARTSSGIRDRDSRRVDDILDSFGFDTTGFIHIDDLRGVPHDDRFIYHDPIIADHLFARMAGMDESGQGNSIDDQLTGASSTPLSLKYPDAINANSWLTETPVDIRTTSEE